MGTRAFIGYLEGEDNVKFIYTHWDGYPSHHGPILLENYNTLEKVKELVDLGGISILGPKIGRKHKFPECGERTLPQHEDWCLVYHRDRGEDLQINECKLGQFDFRNEQLSWGAYFYLFREDVVALPKPRVGNIDIVDVEVRGHWFFKGRHSEKEWELLTPEACKD